MPTDQPDREQGDRFREGDDPLRQLEEIEDAQTKARQGKLQKRIDSIQKSKQRWENDIKRIRRLGDVLPGDDEKEAES